MSAPRDNVQDLLAACEAVALALDDTYANLHDLIDGGAGPDERTRLNRNIAAGKDAVRTGLRVAEVNALVYVGDRVDALVKTLDAQRLTPSEVDYLLTHPETGL